VREMVTRLLLATAGQPDVARARASLVVPNVKIAI